MPTQKKKQPGWRRRKEKTMPEHGLEPCSWPEQGPQGMVLKGLILMEEPPLTPVSYAAHCLTKGTECNVQ